MVIAEFESCTIWNYIVVEIKWHEYHGRRYVKVALIVGKEFLVYSPVMVDIIWLDLLWPF